jgi:hypothetical protein
MNFGRPHLKIDEPKKVRANRSPIVRELFSRRRVNVRGQWWLWIQAWRWKLSAFSESATPYSSRQRIENAMACLDGQKLTGFEVAERTGITRFTFDLGGVLECTNHETQELGEMWLLYRPNGTVLTVYNDGTFSESR